MLYFSSFIWSILKGLLFMNNERFFIMLCKDFYAFHDHRTKYISLLVKLLIDNFLNFHTTFSTATTVLQHLYFLIKFKDFLFIVKNNDNFFYTLNRCKSSIKLHIIEIITTFMRCHHHPFFVFALFVLENGEFFFFSGWKRKERVGAQ